MLTLASISTTGFRAGSVRMCAPAGTDAPAITSVTDGVVVPTATGVNSWYDAGLRLTAEVPAPTPVVEEPAAVVEESAATPAPEPTPPPARKAVWNPKALPLDQVPLDQLKKQIVPDYVNSAPAYLDGSMVGDNGFDPLCLAALANPSLDTDKFARTAAERTAHFVALSAEEQQAKLAWMRESELKHARLAMLAAAGWPLAELFSGSFLRFAGTNGRAPSIFNGQLLEFFPFMVVCLGAVGFLEFSNWDKAAARTKTDYAFDPLGYGAGSLKLPIDLPAKLPNLGDTQALELAEIKNGRLAMMAITGMAVQEFLWGNPVVEQTPFFFGR